MLKSRFLTAIIGIPLLLILVYLGGFFWFGFLLILGFWSAKELKDIINQRNIIVWPELFYGCPAIFLVLVLFQEQALPVSIFLFLIYGSLRLVLTYPSATLTTLWANLWPFFYLAFPLGSALALRNLPYGLAATYLLFILVWVSDTTAFFVGKKWGTHFFLPAVSPNKTIEGSIGAVLAAGICGEVAANFMQWPPFFGFLVGILSSIIGQLGDLFESSLKRWAAVKDSGDILPGHGGVLDRFDSFLFTAPFLYLLSYFIL